MAMTPLVLVFMGFVAVLATIGIFVDFDDRWTGVLVTFTASIIWLLVGMSAFDVIVVDNATQSEPILPMVYLGLGLAFILALYGFYDLLVGAGDEAKEADLGGMMDGR